MKLSRLVIALGAGLIGALLAVPSAAQDEKKPRATASLIPVGSNSDAYWVGEGPGIRAVAIDPGAAPPQSLAVETRDGLVTIPTILNRPSPGLPVVGETLTVYASTTAAEDEKPPLFADFKIPSGSGHHDVFLARAADKATWEDPTAMVLRSNPTSFPAGSIRLVNLDSRPVRVQIGNASFDVAPTRATLATSDKLPAGKLLPIRAANPGKDGPLWIMRTGIRHDTSGRTNVIFYPSRKKDEAAKVVWYAQFDPESLTQEEDDK